MNLVAKIKRLELEAAERDKRIAELEAKLAPPLAPQSPIERNGRVYIDVFGGYALQSEVENAKPGAVIRLHDELPAEDAAPPKKRKPRTKTSGTE